MHLGLADPDCARNFHQLVVPLPAGHVSVAFELEANPAQYVQDILDVWLAISRHAGTPVTDAKDIRALAAALPGAVEIESDGFDFRAAGKGFVWSYPERRPGKPRLIRTDIAVLFVGDEAEKQALLLGEPEVFFTTPEYDTWPLVMLRLAQVDVERLRELVTDAWRMRAPDGFVGE